MYVRYPQGVYEEVGYVAQVAKAELIDDFVGRRVWAVVGASENTAKYGNRVFRSLHHSGYTVYPVNPAGGELEGVPMYPTLASLPEMPEVVNLVVPPEVTEKITADIPFPARLGEPHEYALLAEQIITNPFLNGTTIRLDGAVRLPPR